MCNVTTVYVVLTHSKFFLKYFISYVAVDMYRRCETACAIILNYNYRHVRVSYLPAVCVSLTFFCFCIKTNTLSRWNIWNSSCTSYISVSYLFWVNINKILSFKWHNNSMVTCIHTNLAAFNNNANIVYL